MNVKKWLLRISLAGLLMGGILFILVMYPMLTYAHSTRYSGMVVLHQHQLNTSLLPHIDKAIESLKTSELYNPLLELQICVNDGAFYPELIGQLRGPAFAWGFHNKLVLMGKAYYPKNYVDLHGYRWNLTQLLAHEAIHCYQFSALGILQSAPLAHIPAWKWEGYPEYIARQLPDQKDLKHNIERLLACEKDNSWAVYFADSTMAPKTYYNYWVLVQYCLDIKEMTYTDLLADSKPEEEVKAEMLQWYKEQE